MNNKKRSGLQVMLGLISMIKPLLGVMLLAIIMGCAGNLSATFITILGGYGILSVTGSYSGMNLGIIFVIIAICAVIRGILRYAEQSCNHYIAFKLLARIRHQVFASLRKLAPAKLDGSDKGNLISIITSDIELLEVFYAHTISPVMIAIITSIIMSLFIGKMNVILGGVAAVFYIVVGAVIPIINSKLGRDGGRQYRTQFGTLNTTVLDNLYGLEEILQYNQSKHRNDAMLVQTELLEDCSCKLKDNEALQRIITDSVILIAGVTTAVLSGYYVMNDVMNFNQAMIAVVAMMSSFGPVAALSALSNNLNQTLASGDRILDILQEEPVVYDIDDGVDECNGDIKCENIGFRYKDKPDAQEILEDFSAVFRQNRIYGILGKSGCGKSTLLKLLMRFYQTDKGTISYGDCNVNQINSTRLKENISYVTQETFLFQDTIANNIKVSNVDATIEEVVEAAKKASIHELIASLPNGYDTMLSELGEGLSGGERQRIGIARAFLHNSRVLLLDEPTSNIDSLNEGIILKSLKQEAKEKTVIIVSHRKSSLGISQEILQM